MIPTDLVRRWAGCSPFEAATLEAEPRLVNVQPSQRWSALHQFSKAGNEEAVELLLALHADKAAGRGEDGREAREDPA